MRADLLGEGAHILLCQIRCGIYPPGAEFPGPAALEYQLGPPPQAVRHAIGTLVKCGVLRPGQPLTVAHPRRWQVTVPVPDAAAERVASYILRRIKSGEYAGGAPLPTVGELAAQFKASGAAVQGALRLLAAREIVTGYPPRVGRPLLPTPAQKFALAREVLHEEQAKAAGQHRGAPAQHWVNTADARALVDFQALLGSGLPDQVSMSATDAVARWLRARLKDGTYKPGDRLPSSTRLGAVLGVSRGAVDSARRRLVDEGLLYSDCRRLVVAPPHALPGKPPDPDRAGNTLVGRAENHLLDLLARCRPGERLPSIRVLARDLGIAPTTMTAALQRLQRAGKVETRGFQGSFAAPAPSKTSPPGQDIATAGRRVSTGRAVPADAVHTPWADHYD